MQLSPSYTLEMGHGPIGNSLPTNELGCHACSLNLGFLWARQKAALLLIAFYWIDRSSSIEYMPQASILTR